MITTRATLAAAFACILAPAVLVPIEALSFYVSNRSSGFIVSSGTSREYSLYVPKSYEAGRPAPLVISLPAAGLWGAAQERISRWDDLADREGFIVVYPTGLRGDGPRIFQVDADRERALDVRFISDLIDKLRAAYDIDAARIYANGLSNGGGMAFVLSCTLSDRIAAVGLVSA
ncbi:MAG: alpha/beta hydrolase family esterase, partial [Vicinamibacterales bacterium]